MRDEIDSRIWLAHHEAFSAFVGRACSRVRGRFPNWLSVLRPRPSTQEQTLPAPMADDGGRDAA